MANQGKKGDLMFRRSTIRAAVIVSSVIAMLVALTVTPASAGTCETPECGGEVSNESSWKSVLISNCWDNDSTFVQEGYYLACHGSPPRVGNTWDAAVALQPGDSSSDHSGKYSKFYDADAVRFPSGCVTTAHFWGGSKYTTDRRGKLPLWGRIRDWEHFYIDGVSC